MDKVLVIHGPNLNLLGERQPDIYPVPSLENLNAELTKLAEEMELDVKFTQCNGENEMIKALHDSRKWASFVILNPGAFTHYSYAVRDAVEAITVPVIEVHISNIYAREDFRKKSVISPVCHGTISGFGKESYCLALIAGKRIFARK
ncbi:MAG: type II 3-dehydroquinate dehydratase [Candidatus Eremiobacteraeota bacterium]|nr:type II 3-dehydroquinate dehydratase [Candidatus Eremiobacteraeota bacterium]